MAKIQTAKVFRILDKAHNDGKYTIVSAQGSARSGKTYNILIWLISYCLKNKNTRLSIVRNTLPALKSSSFVDFKEILIKMGIFNPKSLNKSEMIYTFDNGSWVEFFSTDNEQKLRGRRRDLLYVNEANEIDFMSWEQLTMRTEKFTIIDYNPSFSDEHWICNVNKQNNVYHFITTYKDNPFLHKNIIDKIESYKETNESLWRIYGLGLQSLVEGLIFKEYSLVNDIPNHVKKRYLGIDYGYTDPTAIVEVGFYEKEMYIKEHCYKTRMLLDEIIKTLKRLPNYEIISESALPATVQEIYNSGLNIHPVKKGSDSIIDGIKKMLEYKIYIVKDSENVIKELRNYTHKQDKNGKFREEPIDDFNHAIDAARYVVLERILGKNRRKISFSGYGF